MSVNVYDPINDKLIPVAGATLFADAPVGSIIAFAGKEINLPEGYLAFNGQTVKRNDYPDLWAFAVANEQVGVDKFFSQGDGSTTFTLADLRETSLKGYGETSRSVGAHVKSGGLGIGEFIDDQVQNFGLHGNIGTSGDNGGRFVYGDVNEPIIDNSLNSLSTARTGPTTEVKAVGVVWAVKARQTGLPIDLKEQARKQMFPDYARGSLYTTAASSYTMPEDGYVVYTNYTQDSAVYATRLQIDGVVVSSYDSSSINNMGVTNFSGFVKKGSVLTSASDYQFSTNSLKVYGLTS